MTNNTTKATKKEWLGLVVIALPCMLYSMDLTVLNLAIPKLSEDLNPTGTQLLWIVDIYGFLLAGFLITMGSLGDKIGRRKLLMIGAVAFGLASLIAAFSNTPELLIASRALLGIAGATLAPSTLSLIRNMFQDATERTTAIAIWITSFSLGGAIGPLVGGMLLEYYWWGSVFLAAIPVMLLLLIAGPLLLPEYKCPTSGNIDLISAVISLITILAIIYGIKSTSLIGFSWLGLTSILIGFLLGYFFIKRQQKLSNPLLDLNLFRIQTFNASLGIYMLSTFILFGMFFFIAQYLQLVLGLSPFIAGVWSLPSFAGFIIGSMSAPKLAARFRPKNMILAGLLVAAVGFLLLTLLGSGNELTLVAVALGIFSLGIAPVFTLSTDIIVGNAPPERAGTASSLAETASELGGALGIALLGSIGSYIYLKAMDGNILILENNSGISTDTLSGTVAYSAFIPPDEATTLLLMAKEAFTSGITFVSGISTTIAIGLGIVCFVTFRKIKVQIE